MQNYNLFEPDRTMIIGGSQSVSFSFYDEGFFQRIDRNYIASGRPNDLLISAASIFDNRKPLDYFAFIRPDVAQREASLVVRSGEEDGFACLVKGNYNIFRPAEAVGGYLDCQSCNTASQIPL